MPQSANRRGQTLLCGSSSSDSLVIFVAISEQPLPPSTRPQLRAIATAVRAT
ncbi:hypothetical protein [Streptomyces natalensis]|uniref:hypothetical protein n=1 Tax=Streptomyces natalensis TaxID=68242 RepID=UPI0012FEA00D|nr:hypothetical protein [Streptomyces natalensis]